MSINEHHVYINRNNIPPLSLFVHKILSHNLEYFGQSSTLLLHQNILLIDALHNFMVPPIPSVTDTSILQYVEVEIHKRPSPLRNVIEEQTSPA